MKESKGDHEQETDDEDIRRRGEERAGFANASQVSNRNQRDEDETEYDFVLVQPGITRALRSRRNRRHARSDRNRYRQNVIDEQRRGGNESRRNAEIFFRDDV